MAQFEMNIHNKYLNSIREHKKTHEYRLNTKERQKIRINDSILLNSVEVIGNSVEVTVIDKNVYPSWEEAVQDRWVKDFSDTFPSLEETLEELKTYYSEEAIKEFGILVLDINPVEK